MKKIYSIIAAAVCVGSLNAQTLTQANHAPTVGDSYQTVNCNSVGINPGGNGAGQTWNFSSLTILTTTTTNNGVTVASTGSASSYPSAGVAVNSGTNVNSFYSSSTSSLEYWGGNIIVGGQAVTMAYSSSATHAVYPMILGSTSNGAISGTASHPLAGSGPFVGTNTVTASGTGTLMLPGGYNFPNVLKVTTIKNMNFTVTIGTGTYSQTIVDYYSPTSKYPLLTITNAYINSAAGPTTETVVVINSNYTLGMKESIKESLTNVVVYPNPAKDNINLSFVNENADNASYQIVNVIGQTIRTQSIPSVKGETLYNVNLNGIESGIYFVKLSVGNKSSVTKITVQ
jgi:hypothetical protein